MENLTASVRKVQLFSTLNAAPFQEHQTLGASNVFEDLTALAAEMEDLAEMAVTKVNAMKGTVVAGESMGIGPGIIVGFHKHMIYIDILYIYI